MAEKSLKQEVRQDALKRRTAIPVAQREARSAQACLQLEELLEERAKVAAKRNLISQAGHKPFTIAVYSAMRAEVNLRILVEHAYARDWRICYPVMLEDDMHFYLVPDGAHDIEFLQHPACVFDENDPILDAYLPVSERDIDAVIVPMVAFDDSLNRLGYGGGNYDRFLERLYKARSSAEYGDAFVVGVAFEEQRVDSVHTEEHDFLLPSIVIA